MRIRTREERELFVEAVNSCIGHVSLLHAVTGKEYDLKNRSDLSEALSRLALAEGDMLELFVSRREDMNVMLALMNTLKGNDGDSLRKSVPEVA